MRGFFYAQILERSSLTTDKSGNQIRGTISGLRESLSVNLLLLP